MKHEEASDHRSEMKRDKEQCCTGGATTTTPVVALKVECDVENKQGETS